MFSAISLVLLIATVHNYDQKISQIYTCTNNAIEIPRKRDNICTRSLGAQAPTVSFVPLALRLCDPCPVHLTDKRASTIIKPSLEICLVIPKE